MVNTPLQYAPLLPLFHAINVLTPEGSQCKNRATNPHNTFYIIGGSMTEEEGFFLKSSEFSRKVIICLLLTIHSSEIK